MISVTKTILETNKRRKHFSIRWPESGGALVEVDFVDGSIDIGMSDGSTKINAESHDLEQAITNYRAKHGVADTLELIRGCHESATRLRDFLINLQSCCTRDLSRG